MITLPCVSPKMKLLTALTKFMFAIIRQRLRIQRSTIIAFTCLTVLLLPIFAPSVAPKSAFEQKVQPELLALIANQPTALVSVIVQKSGPRDNIEGNVAAMSGVVAKDWRLYDTFIVKLAGRAVLQLAATPNVRWISLNQSTPIELPGGETTPIIMVEGRVARLQDTPQNSDD